MTQEIAERITHHNPAPGHPGIEPRWTASTKEGIGTAYHTSSRVWFTISHGIINEIYFPTVDNPNTRDFQLLVTDGETFFHEERTDLKSRIEYPEKNTLHYRITNTAPDNHYSLVKDIICDPHQSVVQMKVSLRTTDSKLRKKIRVYALLAPHIDGIGYENNAAFSDAAGHSLLHAWRNETHLVMGALPDFKRRSVGFVGTSDGWRDLHNNFQMDWEYDCALDGNTAIMGELDFSQGHEVTIGVGFGKSHTSAAAALFQSLIHRFDDLKGKFVRQWQRLDHKHARNEAAAYQITGDEGSLYRLSRCILLAHEDKTYQGALVASMSIPWGESKGDEDLGGYHLVWPRDLFHSAMALLASGQAESTRRALAYLACVQEANGDIAQNLWLDGEAYWRGRQLDEIAVPALLAWHLRKHGELEEFDPWPVVSRTARRLMLCGPVTEQERWEESSGYSPSTLACVISALVAVSDFAKDRGENEAAQDALDYADWIASNLENWCVTTEGDLVEDQPEHYIRITPAATDNCGANPNPNTVEITLNNGGGTHLAKRIVGGDFLALSRMGIRPADDPLIEKSLSVLDSVIKYDFAEGPGWLRYNHDGYGQKRDGSAYDGTGTGGTWPILTGERGMRELAAGNDALPYLATLEKSANEGGMFPEQLWQFDDIPEKRMFRGKPTGSAMPLCWAHAEYINLVQSIIAGQPFDRNDTAFDRYCRDGKRDCAVTIWTGNHPVDEASSNLPLRLIFEKPTGVRWSSGAEEQEAHTSENALGTHQLDINTSAYSSGESLRLAFQMDPGEWEYDTCRPVRLT